MQIKMIDKKIELFFFLLNKVSQLIANDTAEKVPFVFEKLNIEYGYNAKYLKR